MTHDAVEPRLRDLLAGVPVVATLYATPSDVQRAGADARRIVRHGFHDAGMLPAAEGPVGPKPGEPYHVAYVIDAAMLGGAGWGSGRARAIYTSPEVTDRLRVTYEREAQSHTSGQGRVHPGPKDGCVSRHCDPA